MLLRVAKAHQAEHQQHQPANTTFHSHGVPRKYITLWTVVLIILLRCLAVDMLSGWDGVKPRRGRWPAPRWCGVLSPSTGFRGGGGGVGGLGGVRVSAWLLNALRKPQTRAFRGILILGCESSHLLVSGLALASFSLWSPGAEASPTLCKVAYIYIYINMYNIYIYICKTRRPQRSFLVLSVKACKDPNPQYPQTLNPKP